MIEFKKTAAEMLEYYKIEVFGKMGIDIEGLQDKDTAYQKWARISVADQMLGMDANGDFARLHAFSFFGHQGEPSDARTTGRAGWMACGADASAGLPAGERSVLSFF